MGLVHRESFPVNGVFCAQPRKFSPSKVLPYTVLFFMVFKFHGFSRPRKIITIESLQIYSTADFVIKQSLVLGTYPVIHVKDM